MSIQAKVLNVDGCVSIVDLQDDPSDSEIAKALGGTGYEPATHILTASGWEVHGINGTEVYLVLGVPPFVGDFPKRRATCSLTDTQVKALIKIARDALPAAEEI